VEAVAGAGPQQVKGRSASTSTAAARQVPGCPPPWPTSRPTGSTTWRQTQIPHRWIRAQRARHHVGPAHAASAADPLAAASGRLPSSAPPSRSFSTSRSYQDRRLIQNRSACQRTGTAAAPCPRAAQRPRSADGWHAGTATEAAALHLFPGREALSAFRPARNHLIRQPRKHHQCHSNDTPRAGAYPV
jgi:hypothetical protein